MLTSKTQALGCLTRPRLFAGPANSAGFMDARMLGDTGVAILGSGEGIVYAVNVSNPSEVEVRWQGISLGLSRDNRSLIKWTWAEPIVRGYLG